MGQALIARTDELTAVSDKVIRFRLKRPFPLLPKALAEPYCSIVPERLAQTSAFDQVKEAIGSGPFKFIASERIPGQRVVFDKNPNYLPRPSGTPSFSAGPKAVYIDRVIWNFVQDPSNGLGGARNWWENPTIDLVPQLKRNKDLVLTVKDRTGEICCLRFNHLFPPFDDAAIRRVVLAAMDQKEVMTVVAGAEPSLTKTDGQPIRPPRALLQITVDRPDLAASRIHRPLRCGRRGKDRMLYRKDEISPLRERPVHNRNQSIKFFDIMQCK